MDVVRREVVWSAVALTNGVDFAVDPNADNEVGAQY